ncbi:MAG: molybdenum cofactor biosynthesis protein MoaE [Planctomycetes bacterium]|nr:molybdenum cofactor biosynthesis protein MoaE [Planctomycetota bacterium]MCB9904303.1 molybdenum cofactor biosynthesis protein MoaE [Planctomycetota bacterium]
MIQLFAGLRERAGVSEFVLDDLPDALDLGGLKRELERRYPELGSLDHVAGVVGTEYAEDSRALAAGDEVALLPPVSGGAPSEDDELAAGVFELTDDSVDPEACRRRVEHDSCGAVVVFCGNARDTNRGKPVVRLDYEAFAQMAGPEMRRIFARCREEHGDATGTDPKRALRMLCVHRTGAVGVGEPSVVIAVASPHRDAAFLAARFLIDELKLSLPVWKKEVYADGHHWIGDRS